MYECIMENTSAIDGSKLHIPSTNCHLLAALQEPYKKQNKKEPIKEKCLRVRFLFVCLFVCFLWGSQENGPLAKQNDKTERAKV